MVSLAENVCVAPGVSAAMEESEDRVGVIASPVNFFQSDSGKKIRV